MIFFDNRLWRQIINDHEQCRHFLDEHTHTLVFFILFVFLNLIGIDLLLTIILVRKLDYRWI